MEPKKKLKKKPEQLITAPRGSKIQIPKQPPFKLKGEIVQRKMQKCKLNKENHYQILV